MYKIVIPQCFFFYFLLQVFVETTFGANKPVTTVKVVGLY